MRAGSANALYAKYQADGLAAFFVITADQLNAAPDATYCQNKRSQFGLSMPVLIDPDHLSPAALGTGINDIDLVLKRGNEIGFKGQASGEPTVEVAIKTILGL